MLNIFLSNKKSKSKESNKIYRTLELNNRIGCSVSSFAEYMDISYAKANQLTNAEGFPLIKIGNRKIVLLKEVDEWLRKHIGEEF